MLKNNRKHNKLVKKHRRLLTKMAKEALPLDYGYGLEMFIHFIEYMKDYYETGENIWGYMEAEDGTLYDNRLEQISEALEKYKAYANVFNDFETTIESVEEESITLHGKSTVFSSTTVKYNKEELDKLLKKEQEHWDSFWNFIRDNLRNWWD